jgi:torulene dioxygenase
MAIVASTILDSTPEISMAEKPVEATATLDPLPPAKNEPAHYNDWPNLIGFESEYEQHEPIELKVIGNIPSYAAGVLYRTGPGTHKVKTDDGKMFETEHWFDGFSVVHRFQIQASTSDSPVKVTYNSRRTCDELIEQIRKTGKFKSFGFAQKRDPCQTYFKKVMSTFVGLTGSQKSSPNVGVSLSVNMPGMAQKESSSNKPIKTLTARTDAALYLPIDPETLEPAGVCNQTVLDPSLKGPLSGTHAKTDPDTGDLFNYNLEMGAQCFYRIFQVSASTGKTTVLAKIEAPPAYLHSILLTEHTVVLCVWNTHIAANGLSMLWNQNILESIRPFDPKEPARWYVIDRTAAKRGLLASFTGPAFTCFHTINAYEEPNPETPDAVDIIADLSGYDDFSTVHQFYYNIMTSTTTPRTDPEYRKRAENYTPSYRRYKLPNIHLSAPNPKPHTRSFSLTSFKSPSSNPAPLSSATLLHASQRHLSLELPTLNPYHHTRPYRYHYGISDTGLSSFIDGLGKHDNKTDTTLFWRKHGHTPGEPIFIPDPLADPLSEEDEDRGVLLSVVLDGERELSYLLVLNARDLTELGRAELLDGLDAKGRRRVVGFGFHGVHVPLPASGLDTVTGNGEKKAENQDAKEVQGKKQELVSGGW